MAILKLYLEEISDLKDSMIMEGLREIEGVEKVVKQSEDMSVIAGLTLLGLALKISKISMDIILKIRDYLLAKKIDATMEFKCKGNEISIKGKMTLDEIKDLYTLYCS